MAKKNFLEKILKELCFNDIFMLIIAVIVPVYLIVSYVKNKEGFQSYDVNKNISDIKYYISLKLNPATNNSYKKALEDYKTNMNKDYNPADQNPTTVNRPTQATPGQKGDKGDRGSDAVIDLIAFIASILAEIFKSAAWLALVARVETLEAQILVIQGQIITINGNLQVLNNKTTEMSYVPNGGTYFHNLTVTDGVSDFIKLFTDGTSLFKNTMTFRNGGNNTIQLNPGGDSHFVHNLSCDGTVSGQHLTATNQLNVTGSASITSNSNDVATSIFAVNDNLNVPLLNINATTATFNKNTVIGSNSQFYHCDIQSQLTVEGETLMNKPLHIINTEHEFTTDIFKITDMGNDVLVLKNPTALNNNATTFNVNCDTNIGVTTYTPNNPFSYSLNINSNLTQNGTAHFTNTALFDRTLSISQDSTLLTDMFKASTKTHITNEETVKVKIDKDGNLFTYNNSTFGDSIVHDTTTINSVLQCNGVSNLKETFFTDYVHITNTNQNGPRNILNVNDNAVDILTIQNSNPSNNNVSKVNFNCETNLTSTNLHGNILNIKTGAGQNIMIIGNDGNVAIYNGLNIGSGADTPVSIDATTTIGSGEDTFLTINAPTAIQQNVTIGSANNRKSLIIYGDLDVFGNLEVYGNMRVSQILRCGELVVDNQVQLPQQPVNDMEFGAWLNQIVGDFDNQLMTF